MKKILVAVILGIPLATTSVRAQSSIQLYSYGTASDNGSHVGNITINGSPINSSGYTVGFYYAIGDVTASVNPLINGNVTASTGDANSMVGTGLTLATGPGAISPINVDGPSLYGNNQGFVVPGASGNTTITLVLVAYNGASYETSVVRAHSAAFTMTALASPAFPLYTGNFAPAFVFPIPEPSTFALAGLGLASLLIFRRRK